jgi:hypothetical protein
MGLEGKFAGCVTSWPNRPDQSAHLPSETKERINNQKDPLSIQTLNNCRVVSGEL